MIDSRPRDPVAFVCTSPSWGGLEINVLRLAGWLTERGQGVILFTGAGTPLSREAARTPHPAVELPPHRKYLDIGAARSLLARFRESGVSTAFAFHRDDLDMMSWLGVFAGPGLKLIYQQHMQLGISRRDPVHTFRYSRYDAWISPLEWLRAEVLLKTRVPAAKVRVIPLGLDVASFDDPRPSRAEAREYFNVPPGGTTFGIIGRIDPGKGQAFVVGRLKGLRERGHDARLLVVGDPTLEAAGPARRNDHSAELVALVRSLGLEEHVHLRPFVKDSRLFYRAVDACVMATPAETYGMVTLEAMASGVPVIGTDTGGTREILEGGKLGLLYRPGDGDDFDRQAETVLTGKYPARMPEAARARVSEKYSHRRECDLLLGLIAELHGTG